MIVVTRYYRLYVPTPNVSICREVKTVQLGQFFF